eukprot:1502449-Amphidinium_carterae.1
MPVHQALHFAVADKCRQYHVSQVGALLPRDENFYPLVHHFIGVLGAAAFHFANLIMRDIAMKSAVAYGTPWQLAIGHTWDFRVHSSL